MAAAYYKADYYLDAVGRRRKLSAGAMLAIQQAFAAGAKTSDLADQYGVSTTTIRTITYLTPRQRDLDRIQPGVHHVESDTNTPPK
ncbi:hypothetical protein PBI_BEAGLE_106 [Arthrobacter phage Beagle]|nr:hypothetical protein PBI_BEAGLE_106 [Arthrobacter phage Beagle]